MQISSPGTIRWLGSVPRLAQGVPVSALERRRRSRLNARCGPDPRLCKMNKIDEIVELTKKLIEFESVEKRPDQLKAVVDFVEDYLRKNTKLTLKRFESHGKPSLVADFNRSYPENRGNPPKPKVIFHDHLDVVPGNKGQFKPKVAGDKLFGRGASDTKTNGAVLMVLAKELSKQLRIDNGQLINNVGFMFTTDEEVSGKDGTEFLLQKGYKCDFFVTCEPTHFDIIYAHKGTLWLKVKVLGKAAHGSRPWLGENAALKAYEKLKKLYEYYPLPKKEQWRTTVNLGGIIGGDAYNRVMPECELKIDIRYVEKDDPQTIIKRVKEVFKGDKVEVVELSSGMKTRANDPYIKKLAASVKKVTGRTPKLDRAHGACDGRFYSALGIPAIMFGTVSRGLHTDREYVKISTLSTFYKILWDFCQDIN